MSKPIDWRKVWNAMHALQYNLIDVSEAVQAAARAGHPYPGILVSQTVKEGYVLSRELPK